MLKKVLFGMLSISLLVIMSSCGKEETKPTKPGPVTITSTIEGNVVHYKAEAKDAISFAWDLGNGETPSGANVSGTYSFPGKYTVKCTAKGREENSEASVEVDVPIGDPNIFNDVNVLLSGYNATTGESTAVWTWTDAPKTMGDGPRDGSPDTVYFNPIDQSWWQNEGGDIDENALDDEYSFQLNKTMAYNNNFGAAFMVNWAWAAVRGHTNSEVPGIWEDVAWTSYAAPASSWSVEHIENINDTLTFETQIGDEVKSGAYVIHLTNQASLGMESAGNDYQILKLTHDTLWVRFDNTFPENLADYYDATELENEHITPGEADETYLKLVRKQ